MYAMQKKKIDRKRKHNNLKDLKSEKILKQNISLNYAYPFLVDWLQSSQSIHAPKYS